MQLVVEVSEEIEAHLRAEAATMGRTVEDLVAGQLAARYNRARVEARAILDSARTSLDAGFAAMREKHGIPDLTHLSRQELATQTDDIIARMEPSLRDSLFVTDSEAADRIFVYLLTDRPGHRPPPSVIPPH